MLTLITLTVKKLIVVNLCKAAAFMVLSSKGGKVQKYLQNKAVLRKQGKMNKINLMSRI